MSKINTIENPSKFLIDSGLLFEINRQVLHPYGLALAVSQGEGTEGWLKVWDARDDAEGFLFSDKAFEQGAAKSHKYRWQDGGEQVLTRRLETLGYTIQEGVK